MPKEKLSMGIPVYITGSQATPAKTKKPNPTAEYIGQQEVDGCVAA